MFEGSYDDGEIFTLAESSDALDFLFNAAFTADLGTAFNDLDMKPALDAAKKYDMFLPKSRLEAYIL